MNDLEVKINIRLFYVCLGLWVSMILVQMLPSKWYAFPTVLNGLFHNLTGMMLIMFRAFFGGQPGKSPN